MPIFLNGKLSVRSASNLMVNFFLVEANIMRTLSCWVARLDHADLKITVGRHLYQDIQHADRIRSRIRQLRTPYDWITVPEVNWRKIFDFLDNSPSYTYLLEGIYCIIKPKLVEQYYWYLENADAISDEPSLMRIQKVVEEEEKQIKCVKTLLSEHGDYSSINDINLWKEELIKIMEAAGGLINVISEIPTVTEHNYSLYHTGFWKKDFEPILASAKDRRLKIVHQGFQLPDSIAFSEDLSIPGGVAHRLHRMLPFEFAAAELCTRNIFEFENMPWNFYMDMARITWDEARHAEMVIKRVNELGSNIGDFPLPKWTAYEICIQEPLHRRLLMLHRILEGDALDSYASRVVNLLKYEDPESSRIYDYIQADEVGHALLGQRWFFYLLNNDRNRIDEETISAWEVVGTKWTTAHKQLTAWANGDDPDSVKLKEYDGEPYYEIERKNPIAVLARKMALFTDDEIEQFTKMANNLTYEF